MYRDRLLETQTNSVASKQLKAVMLAYHDFQNNGPVTSLAHEKTLLTNWQSQRLKSTHQDLYRSSAYSEGLTFLLSQLYAPDDFSARDRDLERVFPKLIKWLPETVIETVAILVELNLLTQTLDHELVQVLFNDLKVNTINEDSYAAAYRHCDNYDARLQQITLVEQAGIRLNRYASNPVIKWSLKLSRGPAEKAGLSALHQFIRHGFDAFHSMKGVDKLMQTLVNREQEILNNIFQAKSQPFRLAD